MKTEMQNKGLEAREGRIELIVPDENLIFILLPLNTYIKIKNKAVTNPETNQQYGT